MYRKTITLALAALLCAALCAQEKPDTIRVSDLYTTHVTFDTDIIYADQSNAQILRAKIVEQSKDVIALKAVAPFTSTMSITAKESNGRLHTYIIKYAQQPGTLIYDERLESKKARLSPSDSTAAPAVQEPRRKAKAAPSALKEDAPLLSEVTAASQGIWHLSAREYDISASCINIISYSGITYMVFLLKNASGVSYDFTDAVFVIEAKKKSRKSVVYDKPVFHRSRHGATMCAPGDEVRVGYTLDKMTLSKEQVLKVYFYENGGQRQLSLTIDCRDINKARNKLP